MLPPIAQSLKDQVRLLELEIVDVKDRLSVVEEQSANNRNMVNEANERMDVIEDRLDKEL